MTRLHHAIDAAAVALAEAGVGSPRADAELLAAHAAATERGRLAFADIAPDFCERYDALVAQRAKRVPLQHLTGTAAFRFIDSPLVMWVWLGGIAAVLGGLIAIWPAGARRRAKSPATKPAHATVPASA